MTFTIYSYQHNRVPRLVCNIARQKLSLEILDGQILLVFYLLFLGVLSVKAINLYFRGERLQALAPSAYGFEKNTTNRSLVK